VNAKAKLKNKKEMHFSSDKHSYIFNIILNKNFIFLNNLMLGINKDIKNQKFTSLKTSQYHCSKKIFNRATL